MNTFTRVCMTMTVFAYVVSGFAAPFDVVRSIESPSPGMGDQFAFSIATVGDQMVIGARLADSPATDGGANYVFDATTGDLLLEILNPTPATGDHFGQSLIALDSLVMLGDHGDDFDGQNTGAAYLVDTSGTVTHTNLHTFRNASGVNGQNFGWEFATVPGYVLISSLRGEGGVGSVQLFSLEAPGYSYIRTFVNPTSTSNERFGHRILATNDYLFAGAPGANTRAVESGAVYMFRISSGELVHTFYSPGTNALEGFGSSLCLQNHHLLVSAPGYDSETHVGEGIIYVFNYTNQTFETAIENPVPGPATDFGRAMHVLNDFLYVSASDDDTDGEEVGLVHVFNRHNYAPTDAIHSPVTQAQSRFGHSLSSYDGLLLITAMKSQAAASESGVVLFLEPASPNLPPVAHAGSDATTRQGETVFLDGSMSTDDNGDFTNLLFSWELEIQPTGSTAALVDASTPHPSFVADVAGTYTLSLVVTGAFGASSEPDTIVVTCATPVVPGVVFHDDFESGSLSNWVQGGRQLAIGVADTVSRNGSLQAHLYKESFTEITLRRDFAFNPDYYFAFDMELSVNSNSNPYGDAYYSAARMRFLFRDSANNVIGEVAYARATTPYIFDIADTLSYQAVNPVGTGLRHYEISVVDLLSQIDVDESAISSIRLEANTYCSTYPQPVVSASMWFDNVWVTLPEASTSVLFVNVNGPFYDTVASNVLQTLIYAGVNTDWMNLDVESQVGALLAGNTYDQVWVLDLSDGVDNYPTDWQAIADWFLADVGRDIICDARAIASYWQDRWQEEGLKLTQNYYENLAAHGGGLVLLTDHNTFQTGINSINDRIGLNRFSGHLGPALLTQDLNHPLMKAPNLLSGGLANDSSPGLAPSGVQPGGRELVPIAWNGGDPQFPVISTTVGVYGPPAVDVTVLLETNQIFVGQQTWLRIYGQVKPVYELESARILAWYLDVLNTNGLAVLADYDAMTKPLSDNEPASSSTGVGDGAHRRGIHDGFANLSGAGVGSRVLLMEVPIMGLVPGMTLFEVRPGSGVSSLTNDFIVERFGGGIPLAGGSYAEATVVLDVLPSDITITAQPQSQSVQSGQNVLFSTEVSNSGIHRYQWFLDEQPLEDNEHFQGSHTPQLVIDDVHPGLAGTYTLLVTNDYAAVQSDPATLAVANPDFVGGVEGFEGAATGWRSSGDSWSIGSPPAGLVAWDGSHLMGTYNLAVIPTNSEARLVTPGFLLPAVSGSDTLEFRLWQWHDLTSGTGEIQLSVYINGAWTAWSSLGLSAHVGNGETWVPIFADLTQWAGQVVRISLVHTPGSDAPGNWYIDRVRLFSGTYTGNEIQLISGTVSGQILSPEDWTIYIRPGEAVNGTVVVQAHNAHRSSAVVPFGYTWTWGARETAIVTINNWIPTGTRNWNISLNLNGPAIPGEYYVLFGLQGEFNMQQIFSCSNWQLNSLSWHDGNDYHDLSPGALALANEKGYVYDWPYDVLGGVVYPGLAVMPIKVVVCEAPIITSSPASQVATEGDSVSLTVSANSTDPLTYQWLKGPELTPIAGATNEVLRFASVLPEDEGSYVVRVSNACGSLESAAAFLQVDPLHGPPVIVLQPQDITVPVGSDIHLTVSAMGEGSLSFQWFKDGNPLIDGSRVSGVTSSNLVINSSVWSDEGLYVVEVQNPYGTTQSVSAAVTIMGPDLVPRDLNLPADLWVGQSYTLNWSVANESGAIVFGPWLERVSFLATGMGESELKRIEWSEHGPLNPFVLVRRNRDFTAPSLAGAYQVVLEVDALHSVDESTGEDNNILTLGAPVTVRDYTASVEAPASMAAAGDVVPLLVRAFDPNDPATPAPNASVRVCITHEGQLRLELRATTDANGLAMVEFHSRLQDIGTFGASAYRPGLGDCTPQTQFDLVGLSLSPPAASHRLIVGAPQTNQVLVTNPGKLPLFDLTVVPQVTAANIMVQSVQAPSMLGAGESAPLTYVLMATDDLQRRSTARLMATTPQGAQAELALDLEVVPATPSLASEPGTLRATSLLGSNSNLRFDVVNKGGAPSGDLEVLLPSGQGFLTVIAGRQIPSLAPGERASVTLGLMVPSSTPPDSQIPGSLLVYGDQSSLSVPFVFTAVSTDTGALLVQVEDERTYTAEGFPRVTNATVRVVNRRTRVEVANGVTGADGTLLLTSLPIGDYLVQAEAPNHDPNQVSVQVKAGETIPVRVPLALRTVRHTWIVTPTQVPDQYVFRLQTTFETDVPYEFPVVTIDPPSINLAAITVNEFTTNLTIANHGLVEARGLNLHFGQHEAWELTPSLTDIGDIGPLESVVVTLRIRRTQPAPSGGPCEIDAHLDWWFPCGPDDRHYRVFIPTYNAASDCGYRPPRVVARPSLPPPSSGGQVPYYPPSTGGPPPPGTAPEWPYFVWPTYELEINACDPCLLAVGGCTLNLLGATTPLGPFLTTGQFINDCIPDVLSPECIQDFINLYPPIGTASSVKDCFCGLAAGCAPSGPLTDKVNQACDLLDHLIDTGTSILGDAIWLTVADGDRPLAEDLVRTAILASDDASPDGALINTDELAALLALPRPAGLTTNHVQALAARFNRTWAYWATGIVNLEDVPAGQSQDFIATDLLQSAWNAAKQGLLFNLAVGQENLHDDVREALALIEAEKAPQEGACARVRLEIEQDVTLTRSALNGALDLSNYTDMELNNLSVQILITDTNGLPADELFGVRLRDASGFGNVAPGSSNLLDAVLGARASGQANWLIVPSPEAAAAGPVPYLIGGVLSYEQADGTPVVTRLFPERVVVHPSPVLEVTYFLPAEVVGDDPFTPQTEPPEPFTLGLLVRNTGLGHVSHLKITSAQPQILDNENNLLVDFEIAGSLVRCQPVSPSLTVHLGDIPAGANSVARWVMTSTLSGTFGGHKATYEHVDDFGNPTTTLIDSLEVRDLVHVVQDLRAGSDCPPEFLVNQDLGNGALPDHVYLSDGGAEAVNVVTNGTFDATPAPGNLTVRLTASAPPAGWAYLRLPDPSLGAFRLSRVTRGDGSEVLLHTNAWTTHRILRPLGEPEVEEFWVHLFDLDSPGVYDLTFVEIGEDTTPPESTVLPLAAESASQIPVRWTGEDNEGGSGIDGFDILVSADGADPELWLANTRLRGAVYLGTNGHSYAFHSVATDVAGNREAPPGVPDAMTIVTLTNTAPILPGLSDPMVVENASLSLPIAAFDAESPPQQLEFHLLEGPPGATIDPLTGLLTWTTSEAHGDGVYAVTVEVCDSGEPPLCDQTQFWVVVVDQNTPPQLEQLPAVVATIGEFLLVTNRAFDVDIPAQALRYRILSQPTNALATIDEETGVFTWFPPPEFASTVVPFMIGVEDDGHPPALATSMLEVIVNDFLAVLLGEVIVAPGDTARVPITLDSSAGVSNLCFVLEYPVDRLDHLSIENLAPGVCNGSITPVPFSPGQVVVCLSTCPGQPIVGTANVADLRLEVLGEDSQIVRLWPTAAEAIAPGGVPVASVAAVPGKVVILGEAPLLEIASPVGTAAGVTLYGHPGRSYQIITSTNPAEAATWQDDARVGMVGSTHQFAMDVNVAPRTFVRAYEFTALEPIADVIPMPDSLGDLILYGEPGATYEIQSTTDSTGMTGWTLVTTVTLTDSFLIIEGIVPDAPAMRFRALKQ